MTRRNRATRRMRRTKSSRKTRNKTKTRRRMPRTSRKTIKIKIRNPKRNPTRTRRRVNSSKAAGQTPRTINRAKKSYFPLSNLCNQIGSSLPTYFRRYLVWVWVWIISSAVCLLMAACSTGRTNHLPQSDYCRKLSRRLPSGKNASSLWRTRTRRSACNRRLSSSPLR